MVANLAGKNKQVAYVANLCFRNAMSNSGRNINEIMSEYKLDCRLLQLPRFLTLRQIWILCIRTLFLLRFMGKSGKLT